MIFEQVEAMGEDDETSPRFRFQRERKQHASAPLERASSGEL